MDRVKQKTKKDKSQKHADKDGSSTFITDVKSIKENLKIKEILRTVKMNSSMRVKAPRGSKVMNNKDFNENEDLFNEDQNSDLAGQQLTEPSPSATNRDVVVAPSVLENKEIKTDIPENAIVLGLDVSKVVQNEQYKDENDNNNVETRIQESVENNNTGESSTDVDCEHEIKPPDNIAVNPDIKFLIDNPQFKNRDRKLSLDHTMLTRREGLSQSELDLYSIGKSPLERKSSFFRKKMESFFKNTTEIFKRQSLGSNAQPVQRRGSMSVSLQSLNDKSGDCKSMMKSNQGSTRSLQSSSTVGRSTSSLSASQAAAASETDSLAGSQPLLSASQPIGDVTSGSVHSLSEACAQDSFLNSRAISMSSGLDTAHSSRRRKSSNRSNRVTWVASEGLSHYFRRLIQDEKSKEMQVCHSYSDFTTIPENELSGPRLDSKGRRLSYQRAVSGEDPAKYDNSLRRRNQIPESEPLDLPFLLAEFTRHGVPPLAGFAIANIAEEAYAYLIWAEIPEHLEEFYDLKKLPPWEESRQAVIRELVSTEAVHIKHLKGIVEVFIAAAHALQDAGRLLDIDTERLFINIPDVLNASLIFWESAFYPMVADAVENCSPFNSELMSPGFCRFSETFAPYEKFVCEQTKALDYLRSVSNNNSDFMLYLTWCHSQKECNRLQLADIIVKPMQRLTKYGLILRRLIQLTETEPERTTLVIMEKFATNHVLDLNRTIRQREELEKLDNLANSIDSYDIDFKDEDMDRYFKAFSHLNLRAPMQKCFSYHSRTIIFEGDLRYKDKDKEMEVRAFLLTDMLLITKKQSKGSAFPFKMVRPKYFLDKLMYFCKPHAKNSKEFMTIIFVVLDAVNTSYNAFALSDSQKDKESNAQPTLKQWEYKLREAKMTYQIGVWCAEHPDRDITEMDLDSSEGGYTRPAPWLQGRTLTPEELSMERDARERVAAMTHRICLGTSTEYDCSQGSMLTDSFDSHIHPIGDGSGTSGARTPGLQCVRHPMHRTSTGGSSRQSRLSSFHQSTSAASHDEPQSGPGRNIYHTGSSVEHLIPNPDDKSVTSITVNVVGESESETAEPQPPAQPPPTPHAPPVPHASHAPHAPHTSHVVRVGGTRNPGSGNTLRVHPQSGVLALVHSLPDLTVDPSPPRPMHSPSPQTASDKMYQSHQELLQRNRLSATQQHYLTPNHRGTSYPPPSPTRASLKRGLAFSYSFKNPPLSKMGHVNSQSQVQSDHAIPSTSQQARERGAVTPPPPSTGTPAATTDKPEKKSKNFITRNKGASKGSGSTTSSPGPGTTGLSSTSASISSTAGSSGMTVPSIMAGPSGMTAPSATAGPSGMAGPSGTAGPRGTDGLSGTAGPSGTAGLSGTAGPRGWARPNGTAGLSSEAGPSSTAGSSGRTGPSGTTDPSVMNSPRDMAGAGETVGPNCTGSYVMAGPSGMAGPRGVTNSCGISAPSGPNQPSDTAASLRTTTTESSGTADSGQTASNNAKPSGKSCLNSKVFTTDKTCTKTDSTSVNNIDMESTSGLADTPSSSGTPGTSGRGRHAHSPARNDKFD